MESGTLARSSAATCCQAPPTSSRTASSTRARTLVLLSPFRAATRRAAPAEQLASPGGARSKRQFQSRVRQPVATPVAVSAAACVCCSIAPGQEPSRCCARRMEKGVEPTAPAPGNVHGCVSSFHFSCHRVLSDLSLGGRAYAFRKINRPGDYLQNTRIDRNWRLGTHLRKDTPWKPLSRTELV